MFSMKILKEKKETSKKFVNLRLETELIKNPIFKKLQSLKYILMRFSNKTFTLKDEDEGNIEVLIRIEICKIFNFLLDLREDYFINNAVDYFKKVFINYKNDNKNISNEILNIMPDPLLKVDQDIPGYFSHKNYTNSNPSIFFDLILNKPFIGILLSAFYFTNHSELQNLILQLIYRCNLQKCHFVNNIMNLEVIFGFEHIDLFSNIEKSISKLRKFIIDSEVKFLIRNLN